LVVLEELAACVVRDGDRRVATSNVRRVATLGLTNDALARAVRGLLDAGLVRRIAPAKDSSPVPSGAYEVYAAVAAGGVVDIVTLSRPGALGSRAELWLSWVGSSGR
jgi:hypothetical protein